MTSMRWLHWADLGAAGANLRAAACDGMATNLSRNPRLCYDEGNVVAAMVCTGAYLGALE
jgi:hypothetical protein